MSAGFRHRHPDRRGWRLTRFKLIVRDSQTTESGRVDSSDQEFEPAEETHEPRIAAKNLEVGILPQALEESVA
jgi:hypothetical protein